MSITRKLDLPLLDVLRLLASAIIVYFHMRGESCFGVPFGLPLFLVIMFALAASSTKEEALQSFALRKSGYLLRPWLRWSAFYLVVLALADVARGGGAFERLEPEMVFYGGHLSLWFLPFAALALIPVKGFQALPIRMSPLRKAAFLGCSAVIATSVVTWLISQPMPDIPVRLWLRFTPAIFWGLAIGQSVHARDRGERGLILCLIASLAVSSALISPVRDFPQQRPLGFAIAVSLACLGFGLRVRVPSAVRRISGTTFGIYLLHPFVGKLLGSAFEVFTWPPIVHAAVAWSLSCVGVLALRRTGIAWHELGAPTPTAPTPETLPALGVVASTEPTRRAA